MLRRVSLCFVPLLCLLLLGCTESNKGLPAPIQEPEVTAIRSTFRLSFASKGARASALGTTPHS